MKPISITARNRRRFPVIDYNYQPMTLGGYQGRCVRTKGSSFQDISRQYFQKEARRDFAAEALFFAAVVLIAAAPFLSTASALTELCRAIAPF
jgi:hypothetical protein